MADPKNDNNQEELIPPHLSMIQAKNAREQKIKEMINQLPGGLTASFEGNTLHISKGQTPLSSYSLDTLIRQGGFTPDDIKEIKKAEEDHAKKDPTLFQTVVESQPVGPRSAAQTEQRRERQEQKQEQNKQSHKMGPLAGLDPLQKTQAQIRPDFRQNGSAAGIIMAELNAGRERRLEAMERKLKEDRERTAQAKAASERRDAENRRAAKAAEDSSERAPSPFNRRNTL